MHFQRLYIFSMEKLTQKRLKELLFYDKKTGVFSWRVTLSGRGGKVKKGHIAGTKDTKNKTQIKVDGKLYFAHRLAFLYMNGEWPKEQVDHINRIVEDNSWDNLREATLSENLTNRIFKRKDGLPLGVYKKGKKYFSSIWKNGKNNYIGVFETIEEAKKAHDIEYRKIKNHIFFPETHD